MAAKYVQKEIPSVSTSDLRLLKAGQLRVKAMREYNLHCDKKSIINRHIGLLIHLEYKGGRKTSYGEAIYSKKVALIEKIPILLEHAKYNNFGSRKPGDPKNIIGYYNFKAYVIIDHKKENVRLAVRAYKDGWPNGHFG